jgi:hypothetical protein
MLARSSAEVTPEAFTNLIAPQGTLSRARTMRANSRLTGGASSSSRSFRRPGRSCSWVRMIQGASP